MRREMETRPRSRLRNSRRATAIPVTFLMLFVSLMLIITTTYYIAVTQISARGQMLNFHAAKQLMISLENSIDNVLWSSGASRTYFVNDFGGNFRISPTATTLQINVTGNSFTDTVFNSQTGEAAYELESGEPGASGLYLKGDSRSIVNNSISTMTQLRITTGENAQEIVLSYRPLASSSVTGVSNGKPVNTVRVYVVNMNLSQSLNLLSGFYLKATCVSVLSTSRTYNLTDQTSSIQVHSVLDGKEGTVSLPISSSVSGAIVTVEVLVCNIRLQRAEV